MDEAAVGQLPQARQAFVQRVVELEVLALQVLAALTAVVDPCEEDAHLVARALADHQSVARCPQGVVDQGGGGGPVGIVEHRVVQRRQDAIEGVVLAHDVAPRLLVDSPARADGAVPLMVARQLFMRFPRWCGWRRPATHPQPAPVYKIGEFRVGANSGTQGGGRREEESSPRLALW